MQRREKAREQAEVSDVIHRELRLEPARVARERRGHDPGVVDQQLQCTIAESRGECIDGRRRAEVELVDRDVGETGERGVRFREIARGYDHLCTGGREHARSLESDAGVAAGHDRGDAVETLLTERFTRGGRRAKARGKWLLPRHGNP